MKNSLFCLLAVLIMSCGALEKVEQEKKDRYEMRKNYNNFIFSIDELNYDGLIQSAVFPGVEDYRSFVKGLLVAHLDRIKTGPAIFDEYGVVLTRFLGLSFHKYVVKSMDIDRELGRAKLRISVSFNYENNIRASHSEKGTEYFIPTKPWGTLNKVFIGEKNLVPRYDLSYIEYDVYMIASEYEGFWKVTRSVVDESSLKFAESDESFDESY